MWLRSMALHALEGLEKVSVSNASSKIDLFIFGMIQDFFLGMMI
jgi:hypothetical protein